MKNKCIACGYIYDDELEETIIGGHLKKCTLQTSNDKISCVDRCESESVG